MSAPLLTAKGLTVEYRTAGGRLRAVDDVDLEIARGETLALVGESGCGKSTAARAIARLTPVSAGSVRLGDTDLLALRARALRTARSRFQLVFQDPSAALNARMTVGDLIAEPLTIHSETSAAVRRARVAEVLELVGLDPAAANHYPHQFSGGQRQRIAIGRAIALHPELLIADEPTSALDVSIQNQILLLLQELKRRLGLSMLLISHDLAVVRAMSDRVAVMYLGKIVEVGARATLYARPRHPYTAGLLAAAPRMHRRPPGRPVAGEVPSALSPPPGCSYHTRCPLAVERCRTETPSLRSLDGRLVACHRAEELEPPGNGAVRPHGWQPGERT